MPKPFDLNQLRVLTALSQTRNVTRAATMLGMSQSGFSTALARLRRTMGDTLFVRTADGMEPTPRAQSLVGEVADLLDAIDGKIHFGGSFDAATTNTEFRIAMSDISEMTAIPALILALSREAPHCSITTASLPPADMFTGLESGQIDLALGYIPDLKGAGLVQQQLFTHGFTCLLRARHPIRSSKLSRQEYEQLQHVVVRTPIRTQDLVERAIEDRGISRRIVLRVQHFMTLPFIISSTELCATVPTAVGAAYAAEGLIRSVEPPFPSPRFSVKQYWHRRFHADSRNRWLRQLIYTTLRAA